METIKVCFEIEKENSAEIIREVNKYLLRFSKQGRIEMFELTTIRFALKDKTLNLDTETRRGYWNRYKELKEKYSYSFTE